MLTSKLTPRERATREKAIGLLGEVNRPGFGGGLGLPRVLRSFVIGFLCHLNKEHRMGRRGYPPEFRRRVLDLIEAGGKVTDIARDLGISSLTIYNWRRQARIDQGLEPGLSSAEHEELLAARRRIAQLESEFKIARRAAELLNDVKPPRVRYAAIKVMAAEKLPVQSACRILEVSESGFYAWLSRPPSERAIRHAWLTDFVTEIHVAPRQTYGANRVHAEHPRQGG
jgi:putative transposase